MGGGGEPRGEGCAGATPSRGPLRGRLGGPTGRHPVPLGLAPVGGRPAPAPAWGGHCVSGRYWVCQDRPPPFFPAVFSSLPVVKLCVMCQGVCCQLGAPSLRTAASPCHHFGHEVGLSTRPIVCRSVLGGISPIVPHPHKSGSHHPPAEAKPAIASGRGRGGAPKGATEYEAAYAVLVEGRCAACRAMVPEPPPDKSWQTLASQLGQGVAGKATPPCNQPSFPLRTVMNCVVDTFSVPTTFSGHPFPPLRPPNSKICLGPVWLGHCCGYLELSPVQL